jgi:type IV pilus assembly protein PilQ
MMNGGRKIKLFLSIALLLICPVPVSAQPQEDAVPKVNLELRDVELKDVLRALGQDYGINIVIDDTVTGKVTVSVKDVPLWDAIDSILKSKGYRYRRLPSGLVLIEQLSESMKQEDTLDVREFKLRHIRIRDFISKNVERETVVAGPVLTTTEKKTDPLKELLSDKGNIFYLEAQNTIVVKDHPFILERLGEFLKTIDIETPSSKFIPRQIMIEARLVEMSTNMRDELGIQWGFQWQPTGTSIITGAPGIIGQRGPAGNNFMINLPASISGDTGKPIGEGPAGVFSFGYVMSRFSIDLQLSALEDSGRAKIISAPKVVVIDNQSAEINSGTEIIIPTVGTTTAGGTATTSAVGYQKEKATLGLIVTPRLIDNEMINLNLNISRDEFDFSKAVLGVPPKLTRSVNTEVLVRNGETLVIGGIYSKKETKGERGLPYLSRIPVLGWLFKKETTTDDEVELLIFITPTILKGLETSKN